MSEEIVYDCDTCAYVGHAITAEPCNSCHPQNCKYEPIEKEGVSKRLPEEPGEYHVTNHLGHVVRYVFNDTASSKEYWRRCAIAWMPLLKPYAERRTDGQHKEDS